MSFLKSHKLLIFISFLLGVMPFFWLKPGQVDLGGDGGRLYFYDPLNFIKNLAFYYVYPMGTGDSGISYFYLPITTVLLYGKALIHSTYILISFYNSVKIIGGFLSIYLIIKTLVNLGNDRGSKAVEASAILAGLFYIFNPAMIENYVRALPSHDQVFLNPLLFFLFLRFLISSDLKYGWLILLVSLIFSHNFDWTAAPPIFAFYPLALAFAVIYVSFIRKMTFPLKKVIFLAIFFVGLHAFHLIPSVNELFSPGNNISIRVFDKNDILQEVQVFFALLPIPKVSLHLLAQSSTMQLLWASIIIPAIVILGFLFNVRRSKTILLTGLFFLTTLFFVCANITNLGVQFYGSLFYIPGFSMFRNFYGQWQFVYYFFYALLFGQAIYFLFINVNKIQKKIIFFSVLIYLVISSWSFINGSLVNQFNTQSKIRIAFKMDPKYEETLRFIRSLPLDAKIISFPFTDSNSQVIYGSDDGAYVGVGTIGRLTGKSDFSGYVNMAPYSDVFWQLSEKKDYESIKKLFGILNIKYIFYNSDTRVYDTNFSTYPYSPDYVRKYLPSTQAVYRSFVEKIADRLIYKNGPYEVYIISDDNFLPHIYSPFELITYKENPQLSSYNKAAAFFPTNKTSEIRIGFIEEKDCMTVSSISCKDNNGILYKNIPNILFTKINPVKYKISISNVKNPYVLIFSESYNNKWKMFIDPKKENQIAKEDHFNGEIQEGVHENILLNTDSFETINEKSIPENRHFLANGYANAWYVTPDLVNSRKNYNLILEMTGQRSFYLGSVVSFISFVGFLIWGAFLFRKKKPF